MESFHRYDYVTCKCGEISISGGKDVLECSAKNWDNFLRIDDEGHTIVVKITQKNNAAEQKTTEEPSVQTYQEKLEMLDAMIKSIESLPETAMSLPINHYDFYSLMLLLSSILKTDLQ